MAKVKRRPPAAPPVHPSLLHPDKQGIEIHGHQVSWDAILLAAAGAVGAVLVYRGNRPSGVTIGAPPLPPGVDPVTVSGPGSPFFSPGEPGPLPVPPRPLPPHPPKPKPPKPPEPKPKPPPVPPVPPVPVPPKPPPARTQVVGRWPDWSGSLYGIADHWYGDGNQWHRIYDANVTTIGPDPNMIQPGMVLVIP